MIDIILIVVVLLLVFGASKVRSAGSDLGAAVKGFRKGVSGPGPQPPVTPKNPSQPDAEFPEVLAARARAGDKPDA